MLIAVLGAGALGCCAALELAQNGHQVHLYDQERGPVRRASWVNEGKIHQGYVYANDASGRTARLMARGAMSFGPIISRWIDVQHSMTTSTPFVYAVHRNTMVGVDRLRAHFSMCAATINEIEQAGMGKYLVHPGPAQNRELKREEIEHILDPQFLVAAFQTTELAVDTRPIASALAGAVRNEPRITFRGSSRVAGVSDTANGMRVAVSGQPGDEGPYDAVINALWEGRLAIDETMGIRTDRTPMYRHKFGNRVLIPLDPDDLPSVTMILGPFGDIVNYGPGGMYLSWYPVGMVGSTTELQPPRNWTDWPEADRLEIFRRSLDAWLRFCPKLGALAFREDDVDPLSGIIFAWGETDIDDPASALHERHSIGIQSHGRYHSVDTGKYTTTPMLALEVARRVMGTARP